MTRPPASLGPPKPDPVLRLGLVGHRKLRLDEPDPDGSIRVMVAQAERALREVFVLVAGEVDKASRAPRTAPYYSDAKPTIRLINGLADGIDQLGTELALDLNRAPDTGARFELHCIFPAPAGDYPSEEIRDRARFDALIAQAARIVRLDGRVPAGGANPAPAGSVPQRGRQQLYQAQARFTREHSDLLIAVLDRAHVGSSGGTEETVRLALSEGLPVLCIQPEAPRPQNPADPGQARIQLYSNLSQFESDLGSEANATVPWPQATGERVRALVCLPMHEGSPENIDPYARRCLDEFFAPPVPERLLWAIYHWPWRWLLRLLGGKPASKPSADAAGGARPAPAAPVASCPMAYRPWLEAADAHGIRYLTFYRSAFVLSYALAIVAVTAATIKLAMPHVTSSVADFHAQPSHGSLGTFLAILKVGILLALVGNVLASQWESWHRRGMDFRLLAEFFRTMNYLEPVGASAPSSRLPPQYQEIAKARGIGKGWSYQPQPNWVDWLFRAVLRTRPIAGDLCRPTTPRELDLDATHLLPVLNWIQRDWIDEQEAYHHRNHHRMEHFHHRLHRLDQALFVITLILAILLLLIPKESSWGTPLMALTVIAPATAGCLLGLLYQSEARRLSDRSRAMEQRLITHALEIEVVRQLAERGQPVAARLAQDAKAVAQTMIDEAADWQVVYRPHVIGLG